MIKRIPAYVTDTKRGRADSRAVERGRRTYYTFEEARKALSERRSPKRRGEKKMLHQLSKAKEDKSTRNYLTQVYGTVTYPKQKITRSKRVYDRVYKTRAKDLRAQTNSSGRAIHSRAYIIEHAHDAAAKAAQNVLNR